MIERKGTTIYTYHVVRYHYQTKYKSTRNHVASEVVQKHLRECITSVVTSKDKYYLLRA